MRTLEYFCTSREGVDVLINYFKPQGDLKKSANELSLDNVGGIFVVLLAGMGIACSIAVLGTNCHINL